MKAYIFEGGEGVNDEDHLTELTDWDPETIKQAFITYHGEDWAEEETDLYVGGVRKMVDTIEIINSRFAQATTDSEDGGMTYLVRLS